MRAADTAGAHTSRTRARRVVGVVRWVGRKLRAYVDEASVAGETMSWEGREGGRCGRSTQAPIAQHGARVATPATRVSLRSLDRTSGVPSPRRNWRRTARRRRPRHYVGCPRPRAIRSCSSRGAIGCLCARTRCRAHPVLTRSQSLTRAAKASRAQPKPHARSQFLARTRGLARAAKASRVHPERSGAAARQRSRWRMYI